MGELAIRRNRTLAVARQQTTVRTEKSGGTASGQKSASAGDVISETLRQKFGGVRLAEVRESRRTLQTGEAILSEVQERLGRISDLTEEAASGKEDGNKLQTAIKELVQQIDRILGSASTSGGPLFVDDAGTPGIDALLSLLQGGVKAEKIPDWMLEGLSNSMSADELLAFLGVDQNTEGAELLLAIANAPASSAQDRLTALLLGAAILKGSPTLEEAIQGLRELLEKIQAGIPADEAVDSLTDGAFDSLWQFRNQIAAGALPGLADFLDSLFADNGALLDASLLDTTLLLALTGDGEIPADNPLAGLLDLLRANAREASGNTGASVSESGGAAVTARRFGDVQAAGRDLSGVSASSPEASGQADAPVGLTVGGTSHVAVQSPAALALRLLGSGVVLLRSPEGASIAVNAPDARLFILGQSNPGQGVTLSLSQNASLTLGSDGGLLHLTGLRGQAGSTLHLAAGTAAVLDQPEGKHPNTMPVVVAHGPVSFAAHGVQVRDTAGRALQPFDVIWRTFLPGWARISSVEIDGRQAKMALLHGEPARLWLDKGDRGHPISLVFRGWDSKGNPMSRYAYLHWNQQKMGFDEMDMYPNPFTVTGGEMGRDWVYEEDTRTLRILSPMVTAVAGGSGTDANQSPYWGRLAFADNIGVTALTLLGVVCRPDTGSGFDLGAGNELTLLLENGTENLFEGSSGYAGAALGVGSVLYIDCPEDPSGGRTPAGALTASGGRGGAGIGRDSGSGSGASCRIVIRGGTIQAEGSGGGAGIGAGKDGAMGDIEISGGSVSATGKDGGAGIGGGLNGSVGNIILRGGKITAAALCHAAAVGAGLRGGCGEIRISGTARIVKALGGNPGADIGGCLFGDCKGVFVSGAADTGRAKIWSPKNETEDSAITLPQFRLSTASLGLNRLHLHSPEDVRRASEILKADRIWVAQVQEAYGALYSRLEHNGQSRRERAEAAGLLRETAAAGAVLDLVRQTIHQPSAQALQSHGGQKIDGVQQFFDKP